VKDELGNLTKSECAVMSENFTSNLNKWERFRPIKWFNGESRSFLRINKFAEKLSTDYLTLEPAFIFFNQII
jgi:hypothetical protein